MANPTGFDDLRAEMKRWLEEGERLFRRMADAAAEREQRGIDIGIERERERVAKVLGLPIGNAAAVVHEARQPKPRGGAAVGYGDITATVRQALADLGYKANGFSPQEVMERAQTFSETPITIEQVRTALKVMAKATENKRPEALRVDRGLYLSVNAGKKHSEPDLSGLAFMDTQRH